MKAVLVFIDGTICDTRHKHSSSGTPAFYQREQILKDRPVQGSVQWLQELSSHYTIVYLGARPASTLLYTEAWLENMGFPKGPVFLAETLEERRTLVQEVSERFDIIAGIGDRWDDNELHGEIGCLSIIVQEFKGDWVTVKERIIDYEQNEKIKENKVYLKGKIEGLARVLPLLYSRYGDEIWDTYYKAMAEMVLKSRSKSRKEDLESLEAYGFNPNDLRDIAKWFGVLNEDLETNPNYGLQEWKPIEAKKSRCVIEVTRCRYAELWKETGHPDMGYQLHCRPDEIWLDHPAWNSNIRFEHPKTLMQGDDHCLFIWWLPEKKKDEE
ncbi:MAG: L-2-amino-thiazoline-4-carboxylic acid hydrolase [Theionarchaea archaeon]|nr:L-2-amino-thiazoline-4-carboxylic acid hydrolase [Theionarchaea archaeon]